MNNEINTSLLLSLLSVLPNTASSQSHRPNILFILCDDMGYGDLGCYGQQFISTPHIDSLAAQGMRFVQAYAGSPVSAPSRAALMTGQHTGHTHVRGNREYWPNTWRSDMFGNQGDYSVIGQEPYNIDHVILPEIFKMEGYHTGMFGKWAGGYYNIDFPNTYYTDRFGNTDTSKSAESSSLSLPNKRGVDCFYGPLCQFQAHSYYPNFLNRYDPEQYGDTCVTVQVLDGNILYPAVHTGLQGYEQRPQYSADLIHQYALEWLDRQDAETPFFGLFTYTLPHAELWQPRDSILNHYDQLFASSDKKFSGSFSSWYYRNSNSHAQFAAMITRLDTQVGEIVEKLREKSLLHNTLIIFTSDNGPHEEGGADPDFFNRDGLLQGKKRSTYEGGIRVPFIAMGPNVPKGTTNDHQLAFYDLMPTLCDYAGITDYQRYNPQGGDDVFDGISFFPTLTGNNSIQKRHDFLYWEFHETDMMGLRMGDWKLVVSSGKCHLYNLADDIHEDHDVASLFPQVVSRMIEIIHSEHTPSPLFKVTLPVYSNDR